MSLYSATLRRENRKRPPVWLMRQAGRYHSHYQRLRAQHSFMELCKTPRLAAEVTMGPINDFGFDAAILFSDLLFPLEAMGMGLTYDEGPKLAWHLRTKADLQRFSARPRPGFFEFQAEAIRLVRKGLSVDKSLIGFVGAPLTLYFYAAAGTHQKSAPGAFDDVLAGFSDGRFDGFCERVFDLLAEEMVAQAEAGADAIAIFDTCAGEIGAETYRERVVPALSAVLERYSRKSDVPVTYYSKGTGPEHWEALGKLPIAGLGVDWRHDLPTVLGDWGGRYAVQGNVDPAWLLLDGVELEERLRRAFGEVKALPAHARQGWVCGLGHGVLPKTPEENVRLFLKLQREIFS